MKQTECVGPADTPLMAALDDASVAIAIFIDPDLTLAFANRTYLHLHPTAQIGLPARLVLPEQHVLLLADAAARIRTSKGTVRVPELPVPAVDGAESATGRFTSFSFCAIRIGDYMDGVLAIGVDVSEQVLARRELEKQRARLTVLDQATTAVTAVMEPRRELAALAASVVPALADACAIYLLDTTLTVPSQVWATRFVCVIDPALGVAAPSGARLRFNPAHPIARATHERRLIMATRSEQATGKSGIEAWQAALGVRSIVAMPVRIDDTVHAVITFAARATRRPYQSADVALMREITARATVAVGHALRMQRTTEVSLALQRSLLSGPPQVDGVQIAVRYRPAGLGLEVGGDWHDTFLLPQGALAVTVGDVVGHDLDAATNMGRLRSMLQALACEPGATPASVMTALNRLGRHLGVGDCASLVYGQINLAEDGPATFTWSNAGHPPPILLRADGTVKVLDAVRQPLLGLRPGPYRQSQVELQPGSTLLLYTDGLIERRDMRGEDGVETLLTTVRNLAHLEPDRMIDVLESSAAGEDDVVLLALRLE